MTKHESVPFRSCDVRNAYDLPGLRKQFALFSAAISLKEIRELYDHGKP
jgi:hypothetical protein